jgi:hypothetical protein
VIARDALGYLLEVARIQEKIRGIYFLGGNQLCFVHFVDDSDLTLEIMQQLVEDIIL